NTNLEKNRLAKLQSQSELKRKIDSLMARLANESYTSKAPPHLVKQTQDQLAAAKAELAKVEAELGSM
ncbi:MAG: hypothetical protein ABSG31_16180, partial [Tepidisphaeraceae bacterium]